MAKVSLEDAAAGVWAWEKAILSEMARGSRVVIRGFGVFYLSEVMEMETVHPKTGRMIMRPESKYLRFTPARGLDISL